jgi:hypothetical protein
MSMNWNERNYCTIQIVFSIIGGLLVGTMTTLNVAAHAQQARGRGEAVSYGVQDSLQEATEPSKHTHTSIIENQGKMDHTTVTVPEWKTETDSAYAYVDPNTHELVFSPKIAIGINKYIENHCVAVLPAPPAKTAKLVCLTNVGSANTQ